MGRQKKNELDAILEQLKRSYATEVDTELEDSLLEEEKSDEDAELVSVLEKIFSSEDPKQDENDSPMFEDEGISDNSQIGSDVLEETEETEETEKTEETVKPEEIDEIDEIDEIEEVEVVEQTDALASEEIKDEEQDPLPSHDDEEQTEDESSITEEERVDDVLNAMLRLSSRNDVKESESNDTENEVASDDGTNEWPSDSEDTVLYEDAYVEDAEDLEQSEKPEPQLDEFADEDSEREIDDHLSDYSEDQEIADAVIDEETPEEDEEFNEESSYDEENAIVGDEYWSDEDLSVEEEQVYSDDEDELIEDLSTVILNEEKYTPDELQANLESMPFYKPQNDLVLQGQDAEEDVSVAVDDVKTDGPTEEKTVDSHDLSLFMKFGYGNNTDLGVSENNIREVLVEQNNEFSPEKHKIIHGFTGKEYSSRDQKHIISKKFKTDKVSLLVLSIIISVFAVMMSIGDIVSFNMSLVDDYISLMMAELIILIAVSLILLTRIRIGILSIIRSENSPYSWVCFTHGVYLIYLIWSIINYISVPDAFDTGNHFMLGGYVVLLTALTVFAEYFDCCRESDVFDQITLEDEYYVAEKEVGTCNSLDRSKSDKTARYRVKRTRIVSGFFKRTSANLPSKTNTVLIMCILFVISVFVAIPVSIISGSLIDGSNSVMLILLASIPFSSVIFPALIEYVNSIKVRKMNGAFVGSSAIEEYSQVESLSFGDTDVLEILALTEINPRKDSENAQKWSNIAKRILVMLGGPISEYIRDGRYNDSNVERSLIINSISENGIDMYFDSSLNVLMGDKYYMMSHNIKVKTDVKLTTAIKGADRSIIYVAFDGVPRVGYIVTGKVKKSFVDTLGRLNCNGIKTIVRTYEPEINDSYFETNNITTPLTVKKTVLYENCAVSEATDSGVVATTSDDLCRVIIYAKKILNDRKTHKKIRWIQTIVGVSMALCLIIFGCLFPEIPPINLLIIFYCIPAVLLVPSIVQIVKIIRRK